MAPDEYAVGGGGKLKLKGGKVSDGRVEKKKKKSKKEKGQDGVKREAKEEAAGEGEQEQRGEMSRSQSREAEREEREGSAAKTEAERKYEEVRRKRVCRFFFSFYLYQMAVMATDDDSCMTDFNEKVSRRTRSGWKS